VTRSGPDRVGVSSRFSEGLADQLADVMFALSTPSRVQILGCLIEGPCSVRELTDFLGMEQSAISHQLRVLRSHRLVKAEQIGTRRVYTLQDEHVTALLNAGISHVEERHGSQAVTGSAQHRRATEG
jgi:DNA-binding transcriptional ArsR family regulator